MSNLYPSSSRVEPEPRSENRPAQLRVRTRAASMAGSWIGAAIGTAGFVVAASVWLVLTTGTGDGPDAPVIKTDSIDFILVMALIGMAFGAIVARLSSSVVSRRHPEMALIDSEWSIMRTGAVVGLILCLVAGGLLIAAVGKPLPNGTELLVEGSALATLAVMILGGALLGAITAAVTQGLGVPVAAFEDSEEITTVKRRLVAAVRVPLTGILILLLFVLPFAWALFQSNELATGAAAVIGVVAAGGILALAALGGKFPRVKISLKEGVAASVGIITIFVVIAAVAVIRELNETTGSAGAGGTIEIVARSDITFDKTAWESFEGDITLVYKDEGNNRHTLLVEGFEDDLELEVAQDGDVDAGVINLPPGEYVLFCGIKGHREAGMEGILTVTPAPPDEPAQG